MSRAPKAGAVVSNRERLKLDFTKAAPMRDLFPQLAEVRIEFDFEDGTQRAPSSQAYSYFPAARGFFRFACPCHTCSGEFDLSSQIAELAGEPGRPQRSRRVSITCPGLRSQEVNAGEACPICARIRLSATLHSTEQHA